MTRKYGARNCKTCNCDFEPTSPPQKFCSKKCGLNHVPGIDIGYGWTHLATQGELNEFSKQKKAPLKFKIKRCDACLAPFNPKTQKQNACCDECKQDLLKRRLAKYQHKTADSAVHRIIRTTRCRIIESIKASRSRKKSKTIDLIGMSGVQFLDYLLSHPNNADGKFTKENYGKVWHIDHIRPLASFDLTDSEQHKLAFHYTNCQPLGVKENISKGSSWEGKRHRHAK